jgi:hypothetical protein
MRTRKNSKKLEKTKEYMHVHVKSVGLFTKRFDKGKTLSTFAPEQCTHHRSLKRRSANGKAGRVPAKKNKAEN